MLAFVSQRAQEDGGVLLHTPSRRTHQAGACWPTSADPERTAPRRGAVPIQE